jgi:Ca2+/H+ antiporter
MIFFTILLLALGLTLVLGALVKAMQNKNLTITTLLVFSLLCFWGSVVTPTMRFEDSVQRQCKDAHVSYELVESIADITGESEHDIIIFCKYAAGADMDLVDAIMIIDPDLSEEEAAAIVTMSDLKQNKEE